MFYNTRYSNQQKLITGLITGCWFCLIGFTHTIFANHANGKDVARMTSLTDGSGYISTDNNTGKTVSYVTANTLSGGYVGVANSGGNDRARITTNANGAGHILSLIHI